MNGYCEDGRDLRESKSQKTIRKIKTEKENGKNGFDFFAVDKETGERKTLNVAQPKNRS